MQVSICPECSKPVSSTAVVCPNCGYHQSESPKSQVSKGPYAQIFDEFEMNDGQYKVTWNWWAFIFGAFWYFYKGIWVKGLLAVIFCALTLPYGGPVLANLVMSFRGNYDLYLLKRKHKQI